ncbi:hypothetical protein ACHAWF_014522 [Thalassiosira exigua]
MAEFEDFMATMDGTGGRRRRSDATAGGESVRSRDSFHTAADGASGNALSVLSSFPIQAPTGVSTKADDGGGKGYERRGSEGDLVAVPLRRSFRARDLSQESLADSGRGGKPARDGGSTDLLRGWKDLDEAEQGQTHSPLRQRYTHPALHSKWFKRSVLGFVVLFVACLIGVVALSVGKEEAADPVDNNGAAASSEDLHPVGQQQTDQYYKSQDDSSEYSVTIQSPDKPTDPIGAGVVPEWYGRSDGWIGRTYVDAVAYCASRGSRVPCPYRTLCPNGPGSRAVGFVGGGGGNSSSSSAEAWTATIDAANGWVSASACAEYNEVHASPPLWGISRHAAEEEEDLDRTPSIACCEAPPSSGEDTLVVSEHDASRNETSEHAAAASLFVATNMNEQGVLDKLHPVWFGRKDGWHGSTATEARDFCRGVGDMSLCPRDAYCPDGPGYPLFLQREAFGGEQWAPVSNSGDQGDGQGNSWVLVGTINDESWSTCMSYDQINPKQDPQWGVDGSQPELKENVLCCQNPNKLLKEQNFAGHLDPIWLDESHGWAGGSHAAAMEFCGTLGRRKLCPYAAYCPHGPGQAVLGGHTRDFNAGGEQWAPVFGEGNRWVMIGQKYANAATSCMDNLQLEGEEPRWGASDERPELKKHVLCCTF